MSFKESFKKARPFLGLIIMVFLILACSVFVFFSVFSALFLPLLWMISTAWHQIQKNNLKVTYLWNATRFSMWIYFTSIFMFLLWTPDWVKQFSIFLENKSLLNVFAQGSFMYGRTSIAFALAMLMFLVFVLHYRVTKHKD